MIDQMKLVKFWQTIFICFKNSTIYLDLNCWYFYYICHLFVNCKFQRFFSTWLASFSNWQSWTHCSSLIRRIEPRSSRSISLSCKKEKDYLFAKLCNQVRSLNLFRWRTLTLENIKRLCVFLFQTCSNSLLCTDSQYSSK